MRKLRFFLPFAALGLLASCSNDNMGEPTPPQAPESDVEGTYLAFNIAMPTTRATTYEEGYKAESEVNNVYLYLYRAQRTSGDTQESDAKLFQVKKVANQAGTDSHTGTTNNQITNVITATFQLADMTVADKTDYDYYAFIVVNQGDGFALPALASQASDNPAFSAWYDETTWKIAQSSAAHSVGKISGDNVSLSGNETVNPMIPYITDGYYFTMMNAPLLNASKNGISYLSKLTTENFATSPAQAADAAATVYVQRGVAKVELKDVTGDKSVTIGETQDAKMKVAFQGWSLDVVNMNTYPMQHVAEVSEFAADQAWGKEWFTSVLGGHTTDSHILWSVDPEYNKNAFDNTDNKVPANTYLDAVTESTVFNGLSDVEYCLENTMKAQNQQKNQSTRIVFQGKFKLDGNDAKDFVVYSGSGKAFTVDGLVKLTSGDGDVKQAGGSYLIKNIIKDENWTTVCNALGAIDENETVEYYPEGTTYYTAIIRHFVGAGEPGNGDKSATILTDYNEKDDLGRFGVVRNNTYRASVSKVFGYGSPTVPPTTPDPNDKPDPIRYNVELDVEIINWAIREFGYGLH